MKYLYITFSLALLLISCKKEEVDQTVFNPSIGGHYFYQLQLENYWVYELKEDLGNGNYAVYGYDTVKVVGTEVVDGNTWFIIENFNLEYDSAYVSINSAGEVVLRSTGVFLESNIETHTTESQFGSFLIRTEYSNPGENITIGNQSYNNNLSIQEIKDSGLSSSTISKSIYHPKIGLIQKYLTENGIFYADLVEIHTLF